MQQVLDICKQQQTDIINNSWIEETSDAIKEKKHLDSRGDRSLRKNNADMIN